MQNPFVVTFEIPIENIIEQTIYFGAGIIGVVSDGNYNGLIAPEIDASYITNPTLDNVISLVIDGIQYIMTATELEMQQNEKTFFWNDTKNFLQIHLPSGLNKYSIETIIVGFSMAWYKSSLPTDEFDGLYNGVLYKPLLLNTPEFTDEFDDLFNGTMPLTPFNIQIQNNDGLISRLMEDGNLLNRTAFLKSWYGDFGDTDISLVQKKVGIIEGIKIGPVVEFNLRDARDKFKEETPIREIDLSVWADCDSSYVIPEVWGQCRRVPLQCINENSTGTDWQLMVADVENLSIQGIARLTYKGATIATPTILISADNVAYIEMDKTTYPESSEFKADIEGYVYPDDSTLVENPLDIIRLKNYILYGESYNSVYYLTADWEIAKEKVYLVNFFWNEKMKWREQIEQINASSGGIFLIDNQTNKYTFRIILEDYGIDQSIPEIRDLPIGARNKIEYESATKIISICKVGYGKRYDEDQYKYYKDETKKSELYSITNSDGIVKTFQTNITNEADAKRAAEKFLYIYGRKLRWIEKEYFLSAAMDTISAGDFVSMEIEKDGFSLGFMRVIVFSVKKNYDNTRIMLSGYALEADNSGYKDFVDSVEGLCEAMFTQTGTDEFEQYVI